jgi:O-antigen/teichoic acid export membrane protein
MASEEGDRPRRRRRREAAAAAAAGADVGADAGAGGGAGAAGASHPYTGRRFRKALRWFVVGRAAQAVATFGFLLLAVRLLPPSEYGAYMVLWGLIEIARPLSSLGILPALQQFLPEMAMNATKRQLKRFVRVMTVARFGLLTLFAVGFYVFWVPLSTWLGFDAEQRSGAWLVCAMVVTVLGATFTDHMLEALLEQRFAQFVRALFPLLRLAALLGLWAAGEVSLVNMLWADLIASAICLALAEGSLVRQLRRIEPDGTRHFTRQEIGTFVWHLSGSQLLNAVASRGTLKVVVSRALGLEVAGQFAFMQQLVTQLKRFLPSLLLANLVRPMLIARHRLGDSQSVALGTGVLWKMNLALVWPGVALFVVAGDPLMALLSGGRLQGAGAAMAWTMFGAASIAQSQIVSNAMQVYRYSALVRTTSFVGLVAPAAVWGGTQWGLLGACAGAALALWLRSAVGLALLQRREHRVALDWRGGLRVVAALGSATAIAWFTVPWIGALAAGALLLALYAAAVVLARPLAAAEFGLLERALGRRARLLRPLARAA